MNPAELLKSAFIASDVFHMYDLTALLLDLYDVQNGSDYTKSYASQFI
jgi:hypothetical protein